ncbi:MAG TPA: TolC family protein [Thermoanaerobaculia bacterium]
MTGCRRRGGDGGPAGSVGRSRRRTRRAGFGGRGVVLAVLLVAGRAAGAAAADGQEPPPAPAVLTPAEAVARALAHRPETGAARAEERRAASARREAEAARRPRLDLFASAVRYAEPMVVTPIHAFDPASFPGLDDTLIQGDLRIEQTLYDGGVRRATISRAGAEAAAAGAGTAAAEQALAARTLAAYLRVLAVDATAAAADRRIEAVAAERGRVERLLAVGRAPEVDLRRADAALAAARAERTRLTAALDTAERDLGRLVGADGDRVAATALLPVVAPAAAPPREALRREIENGPALEQARRAADAAEAALAAARGAGRPRLAAIADLREYGSSSGDLDGEWNAGLQVSIPLYRGGATRERTAQAEARRDAAAERLRLARLAAQDQLDAALAALAGAHAREGALAEALLHLEELVRIERLRLDSGVGVQADYLDAEAQLLEARAGRAEANAEAVAAHVELARATGALDLAWVERTLRAVPPPAAADVSAAAPP